MKLKRWASLLLAGTMAVSMLAGCVSKPTTPDGDQGSVVVPGTDGEDGTAYRAPQIGSVEADSITVDESELTKGTIETTGTITVPILKGSETATVNAAVSGPDDSHGVLTIDASEWEITEATETAQTITIKYTYTLSEAVENPDGEDVIDAFTVTVTANDGKETVTATQYFTVTIVDDKLASGDITADIAANASISIEVDENGIYHADVPLKVTSADKLTDFKVSATQIQSIKTDLDNSYHLADLSRGESEEFVIAIRHSSSDDKITMKMTPAIIEKANGTYSIQYRSSEPCNIFKLNIDKVPTTISYTVTTDEGEVTGTLTVSFAYMAGK